MYDQASDSSEHGPKSTFEVYRAEGDMLFTKGDYKKALDSLPNTFLDNALELKPEDINTLVSRSKCNLEMGNPEDALKDAEAALNINSDFPKAVFQKAEAYYQMGNFEVALVFYHRGHEARPELNEFRIGVQKSREAIENAIGDPEVCRLATIGDLSFFKQEEKQMSILATKPPTRSAPSGQATRLARIQAQEKALPKSISGNTSVRQLLGDLYDDRVYLERLLNDQVVVGKRTRSGPKIKDLCIDMINYLDTRTEFWRQQKPVYARKAERDKLRKTSPGRGANAVKYCVKSLEQIDDLLVNEKNSEALKLALNLEKQVAEYTETDLPNKNEILSNVHSSIGNAYLELEQYENALGHHEKDLELAETYELPDAKSRAMDNIGRTYAKLGQWQKAIEIWTEKLPLSKSSLENMWLHHEIGRCYLEMRRGEKAKEFGELSLYHAEKIDDQQWQMNARVLIGEACILTNRLNEGYEHFQSGLQIAEALYDQQAIEVISRGMDDISDRIANPQAYAVTIGKEGTGMADDETGSLAPSRAIDAMEDDENHPETQNWKVTVFTANNLGSGTDANVFVTLTGPKGSSEKTQLDNEKNNFESGDKDEFTIQTTYIGREVTKLRLEQDNSGFGSDWMVDRVEVTGPIDAPTPAKMKTFPCNRELSKSDGLAVDLLPA